MLSNHWLGTAEVEATLNTAYLYLYDPDQVENECLQGKHLFHLHQCAPDRKTKQKKEKKNTSVSFLL